MITKLVRNEVAVVVYGNTGTVKEFINHPQVKFVDGKNRNENLKSVILFDTKLIIITKGIEQLNYAWVMSFCRTNNVPFITRKSNQAVYEALKEAVSDRLTDVKPTSEEIQEEFKRGKLTPLIEHIDWSKSNAENATALLRIANQQGIKSTHASLAQWMAVQRRKHSGNGLPKSGRPKLDVSVELLDDMIKQLGDMRDFIIETVEENRLIKSKYERLKKVMDE